MTMVFDALKLALSSIWQHKIRALLTVLGIVIGVSSVVMFMAVGEGLQRDVNNEITTLGTNLVTVIPGQFDPESGAISTSIVSGDILKPVDVERLDALEGVRAVSPYMLVGGVLRRDRTTAPQAMILGSNAAITTTMSSIEVEKGRMFTEAENAEQARLIVLGPAIAKTLFDSESAVGQTVQIGKEDFEIVGVTKVPDSASIIGGSDYANMAIIPIQTAGEIAGGAKIMRLVLTLEESIDAKAYVPTLEAELLKEHAPEDFTVMTQDELLGTVNDVLSMLTAAV
ncbi:MAG: ABC transporter permease, partial [Patescibacteria group bacterium]